MADGSKAGIFARLAARWLLLGGIPMVKEIHAEYANHHNATRGPGNTACKAVDLLHAVAKHAADHDVHPNPHSLANNVKQGKLRPGIIG